VKYEIIFVAEKLRESKEFDFSIANAKTDCCLVTREVTVKCQLSTVGKTPNGGASKNRTYDLVIISDAL
jgi:hypothetical protein